MSFLLFLISLFVLFYLILILIFFNKLPSNIEKPETEHLEKKSVSILVPFRNEAANIKILLESLIDQSYPRELFTIFFIDDHSNDKSKEILENFTFQNGELNIELLELEEGKSGKKAALQKAYQMVNSEIILSTDADCELPKNWISISVEAFKDPKLQMLCGGVKIRSGKSWLKQFQSVELMSLIGSGAAAIKMGKPIMSNGANLAIRSSILNEISFSNLNTQTASGDDVFLMMEVLRKFGSQAIRFEYNPNHWVRTKALSTFEELVQQRIRWTSKSKSYKNPFQIFVSLLVLLSNVSVPVLFIWSLFSLEIIIPFIIFWLIKMIIDFVFIRKIAYLSNQIFSLPMYINTALLYPFFISYIAIIGQFADFKWKDRNYHQK